MSLVIRECTISELENAPNIAHVLDEYAAESAIEGLPHPFAKVDSYKHMEANGSIHTIGAFFEEKLAGYIIAFAPVLPHYSVRVAVVESFFVLKEYRKTGAGLKLLKEAEEHSLLAGALGVLVSAPFGGNLAEVLPHVGYTETSRVFFRKLVNAE